MALPASDDFNRGDGGLGANWTASHGTLAITSNLVTAPSAGFNLSFWNADTLADDQWSECSVYYVANQYSGPAVRVTASGNGYFAAGSTSGAGQFIELHKYVATVDTVLHTFTGLTLADGDVIRLTVVGTELTVSLNGTPFSPFTDSTFATGQPGLFVFQQGGSVDGWSADVMSGGGTDHTANAIAYIEAAQALLDEVIVKLDANLVSDAQALIVEAEATILLARDEVLLI